MLVIYAFISSVSYDILISYISMLPYMQKTKTTTYINPPDYQQGRIRLLNLPPFPPPRPTMHSQNVNLLLPSTTTIKLYRRRTRKSQRLKGIL